MAEKVTSLAYDRPYRPMAIAAANLVGRLAERLGLSYADLNDRSLLDAACKQTGLDDFGEESFRVRLGVLVWSIEQEARLHPLGRMMVRQNLIRMLANRLRMEDAFKRRPAILERELEPPVVIAGLQRTGTTVIHRLLALDGRFRFLPSWEAINPAPFAGAARSATDPRIRMAEFAQRALSYLAPDFFAVHPVHAGSPEEDCLLFDYGFWSTVPEATLRVPTFSAWLEEQDHVKAYRYFERVLKYLQWVRPGGRWLLKTPQHMEHMEALFTVFPGARIIQTHRDPIKVLASFCSMICHGRGVFSDVVNPREVGRHWSAKALTMVRRAADARDNGRRGQFVDVTYEDIVSDPLGEIRRIYDFLGMEPVPAVTERMERWKNHNPQHKYGRHRYRLSAFGLDAETLEEQFAGYRKRFGIPHEAGY